MAKGQMKQSAENRQLLAQLWEGAREWSQAVDSWQQLASLHGQPKAAMRAAELMLQQGKTDAAMIQLAAIKSVKGEQGIVPKRCWCRHTLIRSSMPRRWNWPESCSNRITGSRRQPAGSTISGHKAKS